MGHIKNILAERQIGKRGLYSDHARVEISENVHYHHRDLRLVMTPQNFAKLAKVFINGLVAFKKMGCPEQGENPYEGFDVLAEEYFEDEGYHATRMGVEEEEDGNIHVHYRDLRMHMIPADFLVFARTMWQAYLHYNSLHKTTVKIKDVEYHPIVLDYVKLLQEYQNTDSIEGECFVSLMLQRESIKSDVVDGTKRLNGLPEDFPKDPPKELNKRYLYALYESIAERPFNDSFEGQYLRVYKQKDGVLFCKDAKRLACLIALGHTEFPALVVDEESGWRE